MLRDLEDCFHLVIEKCPGLSHFELRVYVMRYERVNRHETDLNSKIYRAPLSLLVSYDTFTAVCAVRFSWTSERRCCRTTYTRPHQPHHRLHHTNLPIRSQTAASTRTTNSLTSRLPTSPWTQHLSPLPPPPRPPLPAVVAQPPPALRW